MLVSLSLSYDDGWRAFAYDDDGGGRGGAGGGGGGGGGEGATSDGDKMEGSRKRAACAGSYVSAGGDSWP